VKEKRMKVKWISKIAIISWRSFNPSQKYVKISQPDIE